MRERRVVKILRAAALFLIVVPFVLGATPRATPRGKVPLANPEATARIVAAANAFLATLNDAERANVRFDFAGPQRTGWSNLPTGIFARKGLRLGDLTARQREAALALVAAALSRSGYEKVTNIMNGDDVLKEAAAARAAVREAAAVAAEFGSAATSTTSRSLAHRRPPRPG